MAQMRALRGLLTAVVMGLAGAAPLAAPHHPAPRLRKLSILQASGSRLRARGGRLPGETLMGRPDIPGGPKSGALDYIAGGLFAPARPLRIIDDVNPVAPEDTPAKHALVAPAEEVPDRSAITVEDVLMGPPDRTPAQPRSKFILPSGDSASADEDKVGEKYHKYFKQVEMKLNGDPCSAIMGIAEAFEPSCAEGAQVESGEKCTPRCQLGFYPSEIGLYCFGGALTPDTFTCTQGATHSVEDCIFNANNDIGAVNTCLAGTSVIQEKRFLHCVGSVDELQGCKNGDDISACNACQSRVWQCLDIAQQANSDSTVDPELARLGYNARCGDLLSDERSFAMAVAQNSGRLVTTNLDGPP